MIILKSQCRVNQIQFSSKLILSKVILARTMIILNKVIRAHTMIILKVSA